MAGILLDLAGKHVWVMVKNLTGMGKRMKNAGPLEIFEIEGGVTPFLVYSNTPRQLNFHNNGKIRGRVINVNPNVEIMFGPKNVVSYEFLEEDIKNWGVKASFHLEDDNLDVEGRYKFMRVCEVGGLINLPSRSLGGHFAINHHCVETATHIKSQGIKVKTGLKIHKDTKICLKAKHTSELAHSIAQFEIERDDADIKHGYSLNSLGIIKAKVGLTKEYGGCHLKGRLDIKERKFDLGIQCNFGK